MKNRQQVSVWIVLLVVALAGTLFSLLRPKEAPETVAEQVQLDSLKIPVMLELGSNGCKACENMKPVVAQVKSEYEGKVFVEFYDVRKDPSIAKKYGIKLIPTQIFLKADGTEFFRHEGFFSYEEIKTVFSDMGVEI